MLNFDYLNEVTGGDREFIAELLSDFLSLVPGLLAQMEQAVQAGDAAALQHAAHTLKGSARSIGAESFATSALTLEQMGRSAQLEKAPDALQQLLQQWEQLRHYLHTQLQSAA
jgi:HPt (histidine-containing phosphotransfer) domain-containing protein